MVVRNVQNALLPPAEEPGREKRFSGADAIFFFPGILKKQKKRSFRFYIKKKLYFCSRNDVEQNRRLLSQKYQF